MLKLHCFCHYYCNTKERALSGFLCIEHCKLLTKKHNNKYRVVCDFGYVFIFVVIVVNFNIVEQNQLVK